ncbi:MAG: ATP-binding cassette domain-containing protein, partial [Planifilum sp.]
LHFARMVPGVGEKRLREVIAQVKLEEAIHDPVKTYSLGMRQRLGVAQAILHRPSLLILDEPTNGLDPAGIRELRDYLRHIAKAEGAAVLVSSHLLSEMELMCDRVAILRRGKLIDVRPVTEILRRDSEELQTRFEVDRTDAVPSILLQLGWEREWKKCPGGFEIRLQREETAELNRRLIQAGVRVYGIHRVEQTLEERFLEMTEGDPT